MKYFLPTGKWEGIYKASGHINNSTYDHAGKLNIDFGKNKIKCNQIQKKQIQIYMDFFLFSEKYSNF